MTIPAVRYAAWLACLALGLGPAAAAEDDGRRAGELFSGARGWLNTAEPLDAARLKGQVVLVDFWTYCCINCMHVMPDLKYLEEKYRDQPFVVVGVHSGKFDQEKDIANIRAAVLRNGLTHPVAVDSDFAIWKRFGVRSWPTLVVIDSTGKPIGSVSGEGNRALLDQTIAKLLADGKAAGTLAAAPLRFAPEQDAAASGPLSFPGKVLADEEHGRLFIADTGHHRVVVADLAGIAVASIGSGHPGLVDGGYEEAGFDEPQGLALSADGATLFVCDRQNHALRAVDLAAKRVRTLAGDGEQGGDRAYAGPAAKARLNSPWDCVRVGGQLFIAMAGHHQIWRYDIAAQTLAVHAGNGRERCVDGPHADASFAQPSGLASDGQRLFVADSESSSIRAVDVDPAGETHTLAGSQDLFGFGLKDGPGAEALFQHPLGIALVGSGADAWLAVADTYNQVLRRVDPLTGAVQRLAGTGKAEPGSAERIGFAEPGGIAAGAARLYVADTNQHRIVALGLDGGAAGKLPILPVVHLETPSPRAAQGPP
jgi:thiol-disulfide isomerase/thioredoxin